MINTNNSTIIKNVQKYLLDWVNDYKSETGFANESNESAFVHILSKYMYNYGRGIDFCSRSWSTPAGVLRHFVEGAMLDVSFFEVNERIKSWGLNPERYTNEKNWETYIRLICRDGERLYNNLTKGQKL